MSGHDLNSTDTKERLYYWTSVVFAVLIAWSATFLVVILWKDYGMAAFVATPIVLGMLPVLLIGRRRQVIVREAIVMGLAALSIYSLGLVLFAWEGLVCLFMALPLAIPMCILASWIGKLIVTLRQPNGSASLMIAMILIPGTSFIERNKQPSSSKVTTSIVINADQQTVWEQVIRFSRIPEPTEFLFRSGISYPVDARIEGHGIGAMRFCNFNTGAFVEPITTWNEPDLLAFDVLEQPAPLTEIGLTKIDAAHLHGYFVSERGQFKLTAMSEGTTLLEGTTWYHHRISPEFYWRPWSDLIIHRIHERVLGHIKVQAERA